MLFWVNLHGGFIIAFIVTGIYLFGNAVKAILSDKNKKLLWMKNMKFLGLTMIVCLIIACINPHGYQILLYPFKVMSSTLILNHVTEFLPSTFYRLMPFTYLLYLMITALAISKLRMNIIEALLIILFTHMALYSVRFIPLFAVISAPMILKHADRLFVESRWKSNMFLKNISKRIDAISVCSKVHIWPLVSLLIVITLSLNGRIAYSFDSTIKPVDAVEFLKRDRLPGKVFNEREFGDYIIYALWPKYKVFMTAEIYSEEILKEYLRIVEIAPGWNEVLNKYKINWIIHNTNSPLSNLLLEREDWKIIYADKVASIFVRNTPENQYIINKDANVAKTKY